MIESTTETFSQYVETVEQAFRASRYQLGKDITLYRGLSCACYNLVPSIARLKKRARAENKDFSDLEKEVLEDFKKRSIHFLKSVPQTNLDWLTLAQHHGLPTRLLDWSCNALAALWFTVNESIREKPCKCDPNKKSDLLEKCGVVWIFMTTTDDWMKPDEEQNTEIFSLRKLRVYMPKNVTSRVTTQLGFFTIHPYENGNKVTRAN